ncbi:transporter substrate-binding domain-containing protein [Gallaecimonas kandeliae]|uniref:substrate-binding periplasmic protein n=1 Tax=Gallaecimonas kandeliae TaxID=3029055 RepID=UPI002649168A|nr:transporter substrate-binding domain-containing protein [Gallaecimonas kandeliae]WKE67000.1 transporter substrate-binding domain-containing protein [Gallaecimonas kandeliae]
MRRAMAWLALLLGLGCHGLHAEEVVIGAEDDWYPYSGVQDGKAQGMAEDIVKAAFAARGIQVRFVLLPYVRCMNEVKAGKLLACFDTPRTSDVEADYLWHKVPLFSAAAYIYAKADSPEQGLGLQDLLGKSIATTRFYGYGEGFDGNTAIQQRPTDRDIFGLRQLIHGKVPYFAGFDRVMAYLETRYPELKTQVKVVGSIATTDIYMAFSKTFPGAEAKLAAFNEGLAEIHHQGRYHKLLADWDARYPALARPGERP